MLWFNVQFLTKRRNSPTNAIISSIRFKKTINILHFHFNSIVKFC